MFPNGDTNVSLKGQILAVKANEKLSTYLLFFL